MDTRGRGVLRHQSGAALEVESRRDVRPLDHEGSTLPPLTRRDDEDLLSRNVYGTLPFPESQLMALAHSLIGRGVIDEGALAARLDAVRVRLEGRED